MNREEWRPGSGEVSEKLRYSRMPAYEHTYKQTGPLYSMGRWMCATVIYKLWY
jgi:hypothetical protein